MRTLELLLTRLRREILRPTRAVRRRGQVASYFGGSTVRKLHIGAGSTQLAGWLNTDRDPPRTSVYLDMTCRFPFRDEAFDFIFTEHTIEHVDLATGMAMLRECHRVLRPGGRIRIATPDLARLAELLHSRPGTLQHEFVNWTIDTFMPGVHVYLASIAVNHRMRAWGHRFLYDRPTLEYALAQAGFRHFESFPYGESGTDELRDIERHGAPDSVRFAAFQTLIVEAQRR